MGPFRKFPYFLSSVSFLFKICLFIFSLCVWASVCVSHAHKSPQRPDKVTGYSLVLQMA